MHLESETMCAYAFVFMSVHPSLNLNPCGRGAKEMGGIWWSVFICSLPLLSERNKSHVGGAAWGLRVHPSSSPPPHPSISFLHLIRIPLSGGNVLLMFNHAGRPDANEPETNPQRSNWDNQGARNLVEHIQGGCTESRRAISMLRMQVICNPHTTTQPEAYPRYQWHAR